MSNRVVLVLVLSWLSTPLVAAAQGRPIGLADRRGGDDHALELELDWSNVGDSITVNTVLPKLYGSFGLTDDLELEVTLPTIFVDVDRDDGGGDSTFVMANPAVALFFADRDAQSVMRIGFGVALPVLDDGFAGGNAFGTRGFREAWLYSANTWSLFVPAQVQARVSMLVLGADAALALLITDQEEGDDVEVALELGGLFGVAIDEITLGLRVQMGSVPTRDGDTTQVSLLPLIQADLDGGGFIHGGVLVAVGEPLGGDLWAIRVGGGTRF